MIQSRNRSRQPTARWPGSELYIASDQRRQQFGYDGLGNWLTFNSDDGDGSTWDLEQSRTNNAANEITGITETANDPVWVDPAYDKVGSMISGPKPGAETTEHCYQYDAWNRLRRVFTDADSDDTFDTGEAIHQESRYDGLNRRIIRIAGAGTSWLRTDFYYDKSWRILEERVSATQTTFAAAAAASTTARYQYVWDLRYIDSPILRDEDLDSDGDCTDDEGAGSERLCYANDANFNVTALVETDGAVAERIIYDAYGRPTLYDSTWSNTIAESASKANEIRFCGYVYDVVVGLYPVRQRPFSCSVGAWLGRDRPPYIDGMNSYLFCLSNPPVYSDPVGMSAQKNDKCLTYRQKVHRYQDAVKDYDDTRRDLLRKQRDGATTKDELSRARQAAAQAHRVATYWYRELAVWHCTKKQEERKRIKWIVRETKPVVNNKTPKDVQGEGPGYDLVEDTMPKFLKLWDAGGKNPLAGSNEAHKKTLDYTPAKARAIERMYTSKQAHNFWIRPQCFVCKCKEGADPSGWKRKWRAYWSFWDGDEWLNMEDLHLPGDPWTPALERAAMKKAKEFCVDKAVAKGIWP